jgi:hypothetical protein
LLKSQGSAEKHPLLFTQWKPLFGISLRWVLNYKPFGSLFLPSKPELGRFEDGCFKENLFHGFDLDSEDLSGLWILNELWILVCDSAEAIYAVMGFDFV